MNRLILLVALFFSPLLMQAQVCNCEQEFDEVKHHMEQNHPGFITDIKTPDLPAYKQFTESIRQEIRKDKAGKYCLAYLRKYVRYLKDNHTNINGFFPPVKEDNPDSLKAFYNSDIYKKTEVINIDSTAFVKKMAKHNGIEGIYITPDTAYVVALIKDKKEQRDYVAVILDSRTPLWKKGQVKFELKESRDNNYDVFLFMRNHSLNYEQWKKEDGRLVSNGWKKIYPLDSASSEPIPFNRDLVSFAVLDSSTSLISIRSFGGQFTERLNAAYKEFIPRIKERPNLVIDIRGNGGGSDANFRPLMPLVYTDTIFHDYVELYITDANRKAYTEIMNEAKQDTINWGKDGYKIWEYFLGRMEGKKEQSFFPIVSPGSYSTYDPVEKYPLKVALLYDRYTASSAEQLLINSLSSKKTILVGENSGGFIAFGNVMDKRTSCGKMLSWTTTRKVRDRKYEFVGVEPQYKIPAGEKDWVDYTRKLLLR